jgi:hypothetical protein
MRILGIVAPGVALTLSACGGNQALLASGGEQDFIAMRHVTDEYGLSEPDATVPVMIGDERYTYRVWIHKTKPKILVQTALNGRVGGGRLCTRTDVGSGQGRRRI